MDDVEALRGADANPAKAVADQIADLKLQLARLTTLVQTVKLETVGVAERQLVKDALSGLDGGDVFSKLNNNSWLSNWRYSSCKTLC